MGDNKTQKISSTEILEQLAEERAEKYREIDQMTEEECERYYREKISNVDKYKNIPGVKIVTITAKDVLKGNK